MDKFLPEGSVTYRVYLDLKPGYSLQTVYGDKRHILRIETDAYFHNDSIWGQNTADFMHKILMNQRALIFDSYVSCGAAAGKHFGVLLSEDKDGSKIVNSKLKQADGLIEGKPPAVVFYGMELEGLEDGQDLSSITTNNGAWASFDPPSEPTEENRILIMQMTTIGSFSFDLNVQLGTPDCGVENYVHSDPDLEEDEIFYPGLSWSSTTDETIN
jgi:hypothetical protein